MGEKIIYYSPENPEDKKAAKDHEEEHLEERGYTSSAEDAKLEERKPSHISKEEAAAAIEEAERAVKESRGLADGKFKRWWLGVERGEGAKKLAEWIFDSLFVLYHLWEGQKMATTEPEKESLRDIVALDDKLEPHIRRLAEETILHGAQEDVLLYFMDEWRRGPTKYKLPAEARQKIWEVWNEYLAVKDKEKN